MLSINYVQKKESGFTVIELLVVLVMIAILFALSTVNLGKDQITASLTTTTNSLVSDLRNQQILAMEGDSGSTNSAQPHGIYLQSNNYVLFAGSTYNSSDTYNFPMSTGAVNLSTTFPSNQVLFSKGDGSVSGFSSGQNTITLSLQGNSETITINRFGATTVN